LRKINFALMGCGRIAQRHAQHMANYGKLLAVCDIKKDRADNLAGQYGAKAFYSVDDLLVAGFPINVVSICTPNGLHAEHTIRSLTAKYNVLCEKPMAINVKDCGEMIKAAERNNKRLFMIKQNRFNPPVEKVKQIIDEGVLGEVYSIQMSCFWNRNPEYYKNSDWKGTVGMDGGTLYTQFSHFIDLLYWMIGDVKQTYAFTHNYNHEDTIEFEDTGVVILKFYNGVLGTLNYTINSHESNMEGSITIFAEKGTIKIGGQYLNELEYQNIKNYTIKDLPMGNRANNYGGYRGSMSNHDKIYENLVDVMNNSAAISTSSFEGLKTVEIIDKIYSSIVGS